MKTRRVLGLVLSLVLALLAGWWLFRETYQKFAGPQHSGEEIRFAHFGGVEDDEFWRQTIADFEKANPDVRVRHEYSPGVGEQYAIKLRQQIISRTLPDVAVVQLTDFQELSEHFGDLQGLIENTDAPGAAPRTSRAAGASPSPALSLALLEPTGVRAYQVDGRQRGLPFGGGNLLIFLNKKCFQKASQFHGKPVELPRDDWTVSQFLRTAEKLTCDFDRDGQTDQFGFWLPRWVYYLPFIWSFGAELTDEDATRWTFSGPMALAVMRFYRQLATGDRVVPREEEVPQLFQDTGFLSGKTAMCINGPWFIPFLDKTDLAKDYEIAPIPRGAGGRATRITWDGLVMARNLPADRRERAWRFIAAVLSPQVQNRLAQSGRALPALLEARSAFVAPDPLRRKPFIDALSYSRLQPPIPRFEMIDRAMTRHFGEAIDPTQKFEAVGMLEAMARDPDIVRAFGSREPGTP